jgi:hypothetical protein
VQKQGPATLHVEGDRLEKETLETRLANPLRVRLEVEGPAGLEVEKPANLVASKNWQARDVGDPVMEKLANGGKRWLLSFQVEANNQGDLPLLVAPLRYRLEAGKGDWQSATWKEIPVHVTTTVVGPPDLSQARDITGIEQIPEARPWWTGVMRWVGLAFVVLALILAALEIKRRYVYRAQELAPHEWAERELARLEGLGLPEHGQAERFLTLLSDTVRRYLELRFRLRAPRQTTAEFLDAMRQAPQLTADQRTLLRDFLERCDLAKFARAEFTPEECHTTAGMARTFVEQTRPAPEPVVTQKAGSP